MFWQITDQVSIVLTRFDTTTKERESTMFSRTLLVGRFTKDLTTACILKLFFSKFQMRFENLTTILCLSHMSFRPPKQ